MIQSKKDFVVLVAEDDSELGETLVSFVEEEGYSSLYASNGAEALELVRSGTVHFVLSDVRMPKLGGFDLLKEIKKTYPEVPHVLLISGFADLSRQECIDEGALDLVSKADILKLTDILDSSYKSQSAVLG